MLKVRYVDEYIQFYEPFRNIKYNLSRTSWEIIKLIKIHGKEKAIPKIIDLFNIDEKNAREDIETILKNLEILKIKLDDIPTEISKEKYAPRKTHFDITPQCNQNCIYCLSSDLISHKEIIPKEKIIDTLRNLYEKGMWILTLSGGEPLLRIDFFDILDFTDGIDVVTWLYTNGTLIDEDIAKKLSNYKKLLIQISLDSSIPEQNDLHRGVEGSFNKTVNGIKNLVNNNIIPTIAITVTPINFDNLEKTISFLHELGIKQVRLGPAQVSYGKAEKNYEKVFLSAEKIKLLGKIVNELVDKYSGEMYFSVSPNMFDFPLNPELIKTLEAGCEAGKDTIYISSNGDIYPCYTLAFPEFNAGNIIRENVSEIWQNSEVFKRLRKLSIKDLEKCKKCDHVDKCFGGCRGCAYAKHNDLTAPDPIHCSFFLDKEYRKAIE